MPNPTPGQVAYAAYCRVVYGAHVQDDDYAALTWGQQDAWEAAAQAVLAEGLSRARAVVRHWNDGGPGDGFMELMDHLAAWFDTQEETPRGA